jgi:general secretion pathway protein C
MALAMVVFRVEVLLVAVAAGLAALGATTVVRIAVDDVPAAAVEPAVPAAEAPEPLAAYAAITEREVFGPPAPTRRSDERASALRLWGVAFTGDEARAVVEDTAARRQDLYRVGDTVGEARVVAISWDRVTLVGPRGEETLELAAPAASVPSEPPAEEPAPAVQAAPAASRIRQTGENAFVVDRRELSNGVEGMSGLLTQLRAVAEVRDGRPAGFRLFQIRDQSLFARLGLRDGDVVQRVNGTAISEPAALLGFLQRLGEEPRVALDIVRADQPRTLVYDLR